MKTFLPILLCASLGCAFLKTIKESEIDCGEAALKDAAIVLLPEVTLALADQNVDWNSALGKLEAKAGDAVLCAVAVAVKSLINATAHKEVRPDGASGELTQPSPYSEEIAAMRGQLYLSTQAKIPVLPGH